MKKILLMTAMILGLTMGTHALNVSLIENSLTDNNDRKATNDLSLETGLYIGGLADFGVIKSREEFHSRPDIYAARIESIGCTHVSGCKTFTSSNSFLHSRLSFIICRHLE